LAVPALLPVPALLAPALAPPLVAPVPAVPAVPPLEIPLLVSAPHATKPAVPAISRANMGKVKADDFMRFSRS